METLTYNERNYSSISKEEWLMIANEIASYLSDGYITSIKYEADLRPQDAAILECENLGTIPKNYYKMTWTEWKSWMIVNPPQNY